MTRIGTWGFIPDESVARWIAQSKLDWIYAVPPWPRTTPFRPKSDILKAAGKRIVLRTWFWDATGVYPNYTDWTSLYSNPAIYQNCINAMVQEIENFGLENLYAITISEEEPSYAYKYVQANFNWEHYIYGYTTLYNGIKALYPNLRIITYPQPLAWLTDEQIKAHPADGFLCSSYASNLTDLANWLGRGMRLALEMGLPAREVYAQIFAGTGFSYQPNPDPAFIRPTFETAMAQGYQNISFYCSNTPVSGKEENILFNIYTYDPTVNPKQSPYLHQVAMMELIDQYATLPTTPQPSNLAPILGGLFLLGIIATITSRRSN